VRNYRRALPWLSGDRKVVMRLDEGENDIETSENGN
jgi:hypothetical protein